MGKITFEGTLSGDSECFCWDGVSHENAIKIKGQEYFDLEMNHELEHLRDNNKGRHDTSKYKLTEEDMQDMADNAMSRIYPTDVINVCLGEHFPKKDKRYRFTLEVEEVEE